MKHNKLYPPFFSLMLCAFMLCVAGCTNDDYDPITDDGNDDYMPVEVTFGGMETLFGPYGDEARNVQYNKIHETQDFDEERMLETLVMAEPDTLQPPLTRSAVTNTTLRIVAYDENNVTYKGTGVYNISNTGAVTAKSGEELVLKNGKYYFHCFSPAQAVSISGNNVTVTLPTAGTATDPAFYYAKTGSAVQLTPDANGKGNIAIPTLAPKYCKLTLDVSHSKGSTTTYTNAVLATTLYKGASLALPAGTVTSNTAVTSTTIASSSPTIYAYPGATGSFSMTVNGVTIAGADNGNITTASNPPGMTLAAGNAYKVSVSFLPPNYIKLPDSPIKVAKGNLLYNSSTGKWYLAPDQGYYCPAQNGGYETLSNNTSGYGSSGQKVYSYFNWGVRAKSPNFSITSSGPYADAYGGETAGTHYGTVFGYNSGEVAGAGTDVTNYKNNNDPCQAALGGTWHLPNKPELSRVIASPNTSNDGTLKTYETKASLSSNNSRTVKGQYFGDTVAPGNANQDKLVFLPTAGLRLDDNTGTMMGTVGSVGYYWTSNIGASPGTAMRRTIDDTPGFAPMYDGLSVYCSSGQSLRCISY